MLELGDTAPDFTLQGIRGAESSDIETVTLSERLETGPAVLNFYLFDFHPECRRNVCELHDLAWFDLDEQVHTFGISTDSVFSHGEFARQEGLEYPLLSDNDGSVAESYGILTDERQGHRRVARRAVFVVDQTGSVRYRWVADAPDEQPEWEAIKDVVDDVKGDS
ncbi:redoxin domain-containing protein [Halomicrobium katesii]|uniref:redoxin domain-containing protein n=1 Tax=Halomicrobium katesii TaxID=437163 RepID=UPI000372CF08|nr:redoxin domain-containing protein [Halomicrobium katesii]